MKKLRKYLDKRIQNIHAFLQKHPEAYTPEEIHSFRIEMKKLKFIIELIEYSSKDFKTKKILHAINNLNDSAGQLRDTYVQLTLLKTFAKARVYKPYNNKLELEMKTKERSFMKIIKKMNPSSFITLSEILQMRLQSISKKNISDYFEDQWSCMIKLLKKKNHKPKQLHDLRKQLKKIEYAESVLKIHPSFHKTIFESISNQLGNWHDMEKLTLQVKHEVKLQDASDKHSPAYSRLLTKLEYKQNQYKDSLIKQLKLGKAEG